MEIEIEIVEQQLLTSAPTNAHVTLTLVSATRKGQNTKFTHVVPIQVL